MLPAAITVVLSILLLVPQGFVSSARDTPAAASPRSTTHLITSTASTLTGPYPIFNFKNTDSPVVDPRTGYLYVADEGYDRTTVYDPQRSAVVGFIDGIAAPMLFDSATGELVVISGDGIAFVNATTGETLATVSGLAPSGWNLPVLALDTADDLVYAAYNFQSSGTIWLGSTLHVLSVRLHAAVARISGLWFVQGMTYDPRNGRIILADVRGNLVAIDAKTSTVVGTGTGLDGPNQVSYNPVDGYLYVACFNGRYVNGSAVYTESVSAVDPATLIVVSRATGFGSGSDGPQYVIAYPPTGNLFVATETAIFETTAGGYPLWTLDGLSNPGPLAYDPINGHVYGAAGDAVLDIDAPTHAMRFLGNDYASPHGVAYDSLRHLVYASNSVSTDVVVIDPSSHRIVGKVDGFRAPYGLAYDPLADELFVGNFGDYSLSVVDLTTNETVASIPDVLPWTILFDNRSGDIFVGTNGSLEVISGRTNAIVANVTGFGSLVPTALDSARGRLFVITWGLAASLVAINTDDFSILWNVSVAIQGVNAVGVDPVNGDVYVGAWQGTVTVFDGSDGEFLTNITGPNFPIALVFDPANGYIYVADYGSEANLWVVDTSTKTIVQTMDLWDSPNAMVYDPGDREIFIAAGHPGFWGGVVFALPSLTYPAPLPAWLPWAEALLAVVAVGLVAGFVLARRRRRRGPGGEEVRQRGG